MVPPPEVSRNSQAYINNWLARLQDDVHFVTKAASAAQAAFDYVMS